MKSGIYSLYSLLIYLFFVIMQRPGFCKEITVNIDRVFTSLLQEEDTDQDQKITIDDSPIVHTQNGDKDFQVVDVHNQHYEIFGTYYLSNLLQELALQKNAGEKSGIISMDRIFEEPVERISRLIKDYYWDGLTRRIDGENLSRMLVDPKVTSATESYLYVPFADTLAFRYFSNLDIPQLHVLRLPQKITPEYVKQIDGKHGLLTLALDTSSGTPTGVPFVVPGGRFNEMYGWDSYFEALGLIVDERVDLAKAMVDNFIYEITYYGKILNANRTYYLTRSQPPFLTSMIRSVYEALPKSDANDAWLKKALRAAIREYKQVWMDKNHTTRIGLNRYYGTGIGIPPEVEPGHFDYMFAEFAQKHLISPDIFRQKYQEGEIHDPELDQFFVHDRAVRESGHDTTFRWRKNNKDQCANFVTVDLNSLLYKYEIDISCLIKTYFNNSLDGESADDWYHRAAQRKALILKYLWNPEQHLFFDYCFVDNEASDYISATTLYPLWAVHPDDERNKILNDADAEQCIQAALSYLESNGGVLSGARQSLQEHGIPGVERQWDYPNGWAPHQIIVWRALANYHKTAIADRLIYKWLFTILKNAVNYNGTIPEKFDVVNRSHKVFAEYGNIGTTFSYMTAEGFGWMNASYKVGLVHLSPQWRPRLNELIPPEWLEFE